MGMKVDTKFIEFAKVEDPNSRAAPSQACLTWRSVISRDMICSQALAYRGFIPLAEFFAISHDSPEATNAHRYVGETSAGARAHVALW